MANRLNQIRNKYQIERKKLEQAESNLPNPRSQQYLRTDSDIKGLSSRRKLIEQQERIKAKGQELDQTYRQAEQELKYTTKEGQAEAQSILANKKDKLRERFSRETGEDRSQLRSRIKAVEQLQNVKDKEAIAKLVFSGELDNVIVKQGKKINLQSSFFDRQLIRDSSGKIIGYEDPIKKQSVQFEIPIREKVAYDNINFLSNLQDMSSRSSYISEFNPPTDPLLRSKYELGKISGGTNSTVPSVFLASTLGTLTDRAISIREFQRNPDKYIKESAKGIYQIGKDVYEGKGLQVKALSGVGSTLRTKPELILGSIAGDLALGYGASKVASVATKPQSVNFLGINQRAGDLNYLKGVGQITSKNKQVPFAFEDVGKGTYVFYGASKDLTPKYNQFSRYLGAETQRGMLSGLPTSESVIVSQSKKGLAGSRIQSIQADDLTAFKGYTSFSSRGKPLEVSGFVKEISPEIPSIQGNIIQRKLKPVSSNKVIDLVEKALKEYPKPSKLKTGAPLVTGAQLREVFQPFQSVSAQTYQESLRLPPSTQEINNLGLGRLGVQNIEVEVPSFRSMLKLQMGELQKQEQKTKSLLGFDQAFSQDIIQRQPFGFALRTSPRNELLQRVRQIQKQRSIGRTSRTSKKITRTPKPFFNLEKTPSTSKLIDKKFTKRLLEQYELLIKKGGKFSSLGLFTRGKALKRGTEETLKSLSATFKIRPTGKSIYGKDIKYNPSRELFRDFKIKKGRSSPLTDTFIQRRSKRLTTGFERRAIQKARRKRK